MARKSAIKAAPDTAPKEPAPDTSGMKSMPGNQHPLAGFAVGDRDDPPFGDGEGIEDQEWTAEEEAAVAAALGGKTTENVIPGAQPKKAEKPAERDEQGRFAKKDEEETVQEEVTDEVTEVEADAEEQAEEPEAEVEEAAEPGKAFTYGGQEYTPEQVETIFRRAENSLETEQAALRQAQEAQAQFNQLRQQLAQLQNAARSGHADAVLDLLGVQRQPHQTQQQGAAPQVDLSNVDWSDPESVQRAIQSSVQSATAQLNQTWEQKLQRQEQERQTKERERVQLEDMRGFARTVMSEVDTYVREHPAFQKLGTRSRAALQRDAREAVDRAYQAGRFRRDTQADQIMAVIKATADAEIGAYAAEIRQTGGAAIKKLQQKRQEMPKTSSPRVAATALPRGQGREERWDSPEDFMANIEAELSARSGGQSGLEF